MAACPNCGTDNLPDARFCASCGRDLAGSTVQPAGVGSMAPAQSYASWGKRFVAVIIDGIIVGIVAAILAAVLNVNRANIQSALGAIYAIVMLGGMGGQTLGKKAMKIKVIKLDGSAISYGTAALREIVGKFVSAIILGIGFLFPLWDPKKQALHDKIASTLVVDA